MIIKKYINYINTIASRPFLLLGLALLILALSYPIFDIHLDKDGKGWLPKNSKKLFYKNLYQEKFGSDEVVVLYLTFPDTASTDYHLLKLKQIDDSISKNIYGFESVFSKNNIGQIKHLVGSKYAQYMQDAYFNAKDSTGEIMFLQQRLEKNIIEERPLLIDSLKQTLSEILPSNIKVDITGQGIIFDEINRLSTTDSVSLFSVCFFFILVLLWWQVRNIRYLLLSLGLIIFSLIPSLSLFGWLNVPFNLITMTIPLLFVINFSSYAIHFITKESKSTEKYVVKKIPPVFTSALSSIIGFGSLWISNIRIISQFGMLTAIGVVVGLATMFLVGIPTVVRFVSINKNVYRKRKLNTVLDGYYKNLNYKTSIILSLIVLSISIMAFSVFPKIDVDTNMIHFMKPDNPQRKTVEYIQKKYGSANIINYLIFRKDGAKLTNNDLQRIHRLAQKIDSLPFVQNTIDYKVWSPVISQLYFVRPDKAKLLSQSFITKDKKYASLSLNLPAKSVQQMKKMLNTISTITGAYLKNSSVQIKPAGFLPLYIEQMNTIVGGMLSGLAVAVVLILLVMILLVRDIKLGLISVLITIIPLFIVVIIMEIFSIPFDVGTSIIFSVIIGMIADDVLHIIWNIKQTIKNNPNEDLPINMIFALSVRKIIYPCIITSIMFSIGFSILIFSNLSIISNFGLLSTATIIIAWISDFVFFPAILYIFYKPSKKRK